MASALDIRCWLLAPACLTRVPSCPPHPCLTTGQLASALGIPRAAVARNAASYYGSDAETLSSRAWSDGERCRDTGLAAAVRASSCVGLGMLEAVVSAGVQFNSCLRCCSTTWHFSRYCLPPLRPVHCCPAPTSSHPLQASWMGR